MARTGKKSPEASEPAAAPAAGDSAAATKAKADAPLSNAEKASPVLTAIGKRLRAARKRLGKIKAIEDIQGDKELNADQLETVKAKPGILAIIDELEKITPLLKEAAADEVKAAFAAKQAKEEARAAKRAEKAAAEAAETAAEPEKGEAEAEVDAPQEAPAQEEAVVAPTESPPGPGDAERLLDLLYFSQLFGSVDGSADWAQSQERASCISYDAGDEGETLTDTDLQTIARLGHLMIKRNPEKTISHAEALQECKALAQSYLSKEPNQESQVASRIARILSTGYFTTTPVPSVPQPEAEAVAGGSESSEYRNIAVSGAEAVLEAPAPQSSAFAPHQALHGVELGSSQQQFYSPVYATGGYDQSAANAAFHSVPYQEPATNFMVNSTLEGTQPSFGSLPPQDPPQPQQQHQQAPPAQQQPAAPQPQAPPQTQASTDPVVSAPSAASVPLPSQQQQQQASEQPKMNGVAGNDAPAAAGGGEAPGPDSAAQQYNGGRGGRGGRGPRPRGGRAGRGSDRPSGELSGEGGEGQGRGSGRGYQGRGGRGYQGDGGGRGGYRGRGDGGEGGYQGGYHGGYRGGRGGRGGRMGGEGRGPAPQQAHQGPGVPSGPKPGGQ
mmetsp:Transcript_11211/g.33634  ORF Transcript_11211/g.33634 Transcript_11211/m.33634 type:complete len:612 (+) Transcript_11211:95-1930(+)